MAIEIEISICFMCMQYRGYPLHIACAKVSPRVVHHLLENGADVTLVHPEVEIYPFSIVCILFSIWNIVNTAIAVGWNCTRCANEGMRRRASGGMEGCTTCTKECRCPLPEKEGEGSTA